MNIELAFPPIFFVAAAVAAAGSRTTLAVVVAAALLLELATGLVVLTEGIPEALRGCVASIGIICSIPAARERVSLDKASKATVVSNLCDDFQNDPRLVALGMSRDVLLQLGSDEGLVALVSVGV